MDPVEIGKEFLAHYASEYYDPVKAREYYERTKKLKGGNAAPPKDESKEQRKARIETAQNQRQAISYANKQIGTRKQTESKAAQKAQTIRMERLRKSSEASRKRISDALTKRLNEIKAKAQIKAEPVKLNVIPADASPAKRAYLEKQNEQLLKAAQRKNADAKAAANKEAVQATDAARKEARVAMKQIGTDLKAMVTQARADYQAGNKARTSKFKLAKETEEKNIKANVR